ncbi:MAG: hypothetical protein ACOCX2_07060 [Armatimonadota bacterium]
MAIALGLLIAAPVTAQVIDDRVRTRVEQGVAESIERLYAAVEPEPGEVEALAQELADALKDWSWERRREGLGRASEHPEIGLLALHSILTSEDAEARVKAAYATGRIARAEQILEWEAPDLSETVVWLLLLGTLDDIAEVRQESVSGLSGICELGPPVWARERAAAGLRELCIIVLHHLAQDVDANVRGRAHGALYAGGVGPLPPSWDYKLTMRLPFPSTAAMQPVPVLVALAYAGAETTYIVPFEVIVELTDAEGATTEITVGPPPERPWPDVYEYDHQGYPVRLTPLWAYEPGDVDAWIVPDVIADHEPLARGTYRVSARIELRVYFSEEKEIFIREGEDPPTWGGVGLYLFEIPLTAEPVELTIWGVE